MQAVEFGKAAASAEVQRWQNAGLRIGKRIAFLVVAAIFALFALISAHVTLWVLCYGPWHTGRVWASLIVLGADLLFAVVFVLLGRSRSPGIAEIESRMERDRNLAAMRNALALSTVTATLTGPVGRMAGRGLWGMVRGRRRRRGYKDRV